MQSYPIIYAKRTELSPTHLNIIEGELPEDIYGVIYLTSPSGTVNSGGLPYPEHYQDGSFNREFASPLMNGDGMIFKIDFNTPKQAILMSKLMKTPCFYADEATGRNGTSSYKKKYHFRNTGIARMSLRLGSRNELNTAIIPLQFADDEAPRMVATYDVGRPFEIDPDTLELITPIGSNKEWKAGMPPFLKFPFPLVQSTAHPVYDANTKEFFTTNYTRSPKTMISSSHFISMMLKKEKALEEQLEKWADEFEAKKKTIKESNEEELSKHKETFMQRVEAFFERPDLIIGKAEAEIEKIADNAFSVPNEVYVKRWTADNKNIKTWKIVNEQGEGLTIRQCMHQVSISRNFLILADSSFKFTIDLLINNPFPHNHKIDKFIRELTAGPMLPYLTVYLVDRTELKDNNDTIVAKELKEPIPLESVHFSADYDDQNGEKVTLYLAHNSAACMAEWLRAYDTLATQTQQSVEKNLMGMFAIGGMDINRVGRFVIDTQTATIDEQASKVAYDTGNLEDVQKIGGHTWELGLYTYRDMIAPNKMVEKIKQLYFTSIGLDPRMLSEFIFNLYSKKYPNREISVKDILKYTKEGLPSCLFRMDTENMNIVDFFQLPYDNNPRSIQFMPRKTPTPNVDESVDGYILCTILAVVNPEAPSEQRTYSPQIWIFDAQNLNQGPVCKMTHPDFTFAFTLHSAWIEEAKTPKVNYKINIREDYDYLIQQFFYCRRKKMQRFFNKYVYPHFE